MNTKLNSKLKTDELQREEPLSLQVYNGRTNTSGSRFKETSWPECHLEFELSEKQGKHIRWTEKAEQTWKRGRLLGNKERKTGKESKKEGEN